MGTDKTGASLRGLLTHDPRLELWEAQSGEYDGGTRLSALQSMTPVAGLCVPGQTTAMGLSATGPQSAPLYIKTVRQGLPCVDEAGLLWSDTDGSKYRGCDLPNVITHWEPLSDSHIHRSPHLKALPNGKLILAYWHSGSGVEVRVRSTAGVWTAAIPVSTEVTTDPRPCLDIRPDGRIFLYRFYEQSATEVQVRTYYSDDDGTTWSDGGYALDAVISLTAYPSYHRIRTAYLNGQVLMLLHLRRDGPGTGEYLDVIRQLASSDGGNLFTEVFTEAGTSAPYSSSSPEIIVDQGVFLIGRLYYHSIPYGVCVKWVRIGTAFTRFDYAAPFSDSTSADTGIDLATVTASGGDFYFGFAWFAAWNDDDGSLYMTAMNATTKACPILRSPDHGATWQGTGQSARYTSLGQCWWDHHDTNEAPVNFSGCAHRGRSAIATGWYNGGVEADPLGVAYLGGWTTETMGRRFEVSKPTLRRAWEYPGVSTHLPTDTFWAATGAGSESIATYKLVTTAGVGQVRNYDFVPSTTINQGLTGEWAVIVTDPPVEMRLRTSDATPQGYEAYVEITANKVRLVDGATDVLIAEIDRPTSSTGYRVRLALQADNCRAWVCVNTSLEDRVWTLVGSTTTLTDLAANPGNRAKFGQSGEGNSTWTEWHVSNASYSGADSWVVASGPLTLYPRPVLPTGVYFGLGVELSATSGPSVIGDTWSITPTAEYPIEALDPLTTPSPRHTWRSRLISEMSTADEVRLAWRIGSVDTFGMGDLWGVYIDGANMGGIKVDLYYAAAWHAVATTGYEDFTASRDGQTILCAAAGTAGSTIWRRGELNGASAEFISGAAPHVSDWQGVIDYNRQGSTKMSGTTVTLAAVLETSAAGESASPLVRVYPRRHLVLFRLAAHSQFITGIRLTFYRRTGISSLLTPNNPSQGYYELSQVVMGPVWAWGSEYSWGRSLTLSPNVETVTADDGTQIVRRKGPPKRIVEMSWSDGVDESEYRASTSPDYVAYNSGGVPIAFLRDTALDIVDEVRELEGALTPVVYLPSIPRASAGGYSSWAKGAVYGRITGDVTIDTVIGEEESTEIQRLQKLVIEEIT